MEKHPLTHNIYMEQLPTMSYTPATKTYEYPSDDGEFLYDKNTLYCSRGDLSPPSVEATIREYVRLASEYLKEKYPGKYPPVCDVKINIPIDKDGKYFHSGYARVPSFIYFTLLGRSPEGCELVESVKVKNPNFNVDDWGDEEYIIQKIPILPAIGRLTRKYSLQELQPQIVLFEARNGRKPDHDEIQLFHTMELSRTPIYPVKDYLVANTLIATSMPPWITSDIIYREMKRYASSPEKLVIDLYREHGMQTCLVIFEEGTNDAAFALKMCMRTTFVDGHNKYNAIFSHRDIEYLKPCEREPNHITRGGDQSRGRGRGGNTTQPQKRPPPKRVNFSDDDGFCTRGGRGRR